MEVSQPLTPALQHESVSTTGSMDDALDSSSPEMFMATSVEYFRSHPEELKEGRYTEIHEVDGKPFLAISPRPMRPYGATVGGHHSLIDEMRGYNEATQFPNFMEAVSVLGSEADDLDATSTTLRAKGILCQDGAELNLIVQDMRRDANRLLGSLQDTASRSGIDRVLVQKLYEPKDREPIDLSTAERQIEIRADYKMLHEADTGVPENPDVLVGIVTAAEVGDTSIRMANSKAARTTGVSLSMLESHIPRHAALYEAASIKDEHGYIDFAVDNQAIRLGVRYSSHTYRGEKEQTINLFYDKDYGKIALPLQEAILHEITCYGFQNSPPDTLTAVTIARPDTQGRTVIERQKLDVNGKSLRPV